MHHKTEKLVRVEGEMDGEKQRNELVIMSMHKTFLCIIVSENLYFESIQTHQLSFKNDKFS